MFTVLFTMSVFLMTGLLVDGGLAIHARERAYDIAEQAARAGANDINEATLRRTGRPEINAGTACRRTTSLLTAYNLNEKKYFDCQATTQEVTVTVHIAVEPQFLTIVPGVGTFNMTGTASAHPDKGNP